MWIIIIEFRLIHLAQKQDLPLGRHTCCIVVVIGRYESRDMKLLLQVIYWHLLPFRFYHMGKTLILEQFSNLCATKALYLAE